MKMAKRLLFLAFQNSSHRRPVALQQRISFFSSPAATVVIDDDVRRFQELPELHPLLKANIRHDEMTEIQAKTFDAASQGADVLGRARTGTGKTVGFLLPALQRLLASEQQNPPRESKKGIRMLVLSPTRELALQIGDQVNELSKNTGVSHQVVVGGSSKPKDVKLFERNVPKVLVATPGRLNDHLETTEVKGKSFSALLRSLDVLVLDETDRLLDMGFREDVEKIIKYLPKKRQTLLFSATVPDSVKSIIQKTMKEDFITVDCIHDADPMSHTNAQVQQSHVIVPYDSRMVTGALDVIMKLVADAKKTKEPLKLVVFLSTAHLVSFYSQVLKKARVDAELFELHSRKTQSYRTRVSDQFRKASSGILMTTDVSARGVDYPNVSHVVQIGIADSRESYIHRLGRTGRAGNVGEGLLILTDKEAKFLDTLEGLDVPNHAEFQAVMDKPTTMKNLDRILANRDVHNAMESAYRSLLGFYNGKLAKLGEKGLDRVVGFANSFAWQAGAESLPTFERKTLAKMGLSKAEGLNIQDGPSKRNGSGGGIPRDNDDKSDDHRMRHQGGSQRADGGRNRDDRHDGWSVNKKPHSARGSGRKGTEYKTDGNDNGHRSRRRNFNHRNNEQNSELADRAPRTWSRGRYS